MASQDSPALRGGPVRTCVGCRKRAAAHELLRVTVGSDSHGPAVMPDPAGTALGRGAHLHPTPECYDLAVRRKAFARALRHDGGLTVTTLGDYLDSRSDQQRPTETGARSS